MKNVAYQKYLFIKEYLGDILKVSFVNQRPNFKNLSRGLNLRRTQIWLGPLKIVFNVPNSMFKPELTWNRFLAE